MKRVRRRKTTRKRARQRVHIGVPDPSLTATSGVVAVAEFVEALDVVGRFDRGVGSIKKRDRGASAGEVLVGMAQSQLLGADALVGLDRQRADVAAVELSAVPVLASTTAAGLARRFGPEQLAGIEAGVADLAQRAFDLLDAERKTGLSSKVTIDLDSTDVEVYGSKKDGVAYNYQGQRAGRPHLATWAEAGLTTAADLLAGNDDVRPRAADMLARGLAGVPERVRETARAGDRLRTRADAGYFTADLAHAAVEEGCDFAIAAKRNTALWRAYATIPEAAWVDAIGMSGAQVAAVDYAPAGWPEGTYTIVRRVRVEAEDISADPGRGGGEPSTRTSSPSPWKAPRPTRTRSPSSSPTSPPTTSPAITTVTLRRSLRSRPGTGAAPTSRTGSVRPNSARRCASFPPGTRRSTLCGCGQRSWPGTSRPCSKP